MVDFFRRQLDELMGPNRDGGGPSLPDDYADPRVCRDFLCGFCPSSRPLERVGAAGERCDRQHSERLRSEFEKDLASRREPAPSMHRAHRGDMARILGDVDRRIARAERRLDDQGRQHLEAMFPMLASRRREGLVPKKKKKKK
jgi:hypothetical protein